MADDIGKNIIGAFKMLAIIVGLVGALFVTSFIIVLVVGVLFNVVSAGSLNVTNASETQLGAVEAGFHTVMGTIITSAGFAGSLIVVAIVLLVFAGLGMWGYGQYKKVSGRKTRGKGDLGY